MSTQRDALREYLRALAATHATGRATTERSYYPALSTLLNAVGATLQPKIGADAEIKAVDGDAPDFGLFSAHQRRAGAHGDLYAGTSIPERGVVEVKGADAELDKIVASEQVKRYLATFQIVLVTNLREFRLLSRDNGEEERFVLAASEEKLWSLTSKPQRADDLAVALFEFLTRAMLRRAQIAKPEELAFFVASYAREALDFVGHTNLRDLDELRETLEQALGIHFEGDEGDHFFRSTFIQSLFYGVFSAFQLWHEQHPPSNRSARFRWHDSQFINHIQIVQTLLHRFMGPEMMGKSRLRTLLDLTEQTLNRVDRAAFFSAFQQGTAIQYFYEPFLAAFDPRLRKDLGVWYTPTEVVDYMVERVDRALREELGIAAGLADENVMVLDPCCGTGAYITAVLTRIEKTLRETRDPALVGAALEKAATERIHGFEIIPAPFIIAHMNVELFLRRRGVSLDGSQRAAIFLTNALTGWEGEPPQLKLTLDVFRREREAAQDTKRDKPVLVVLGNPPYNAFAGVGSTEEESRLVQPYKEGLQKEWGIRKFNLDDLYVRFFRLAERRIAEISGKGVVCYITNYSWISEPSYVVMRQHLLERFDSIWIDSLNGDSRATGKLTPDGAPDPSVFSTPLNPAGIRVGTAICLMTKRSTRSRKASAAVGYREFWGREKKRLLIESLSSTGDANRFAHSHPTRENRHRLRVDSVRSEYLEWPSVADLCGVPPYNGPMEKRGGALFGESREHCLIGISELLSMGGTGLNSVGGPLTATHARYSPTVASRNLRTAGGLGAVEPVRYMLRPIDNCWAAYTVVRPIWNEPRPSLYKQFWDGNQFIVSRPSSAAVPEGSPIFVTSALGDNDALRGHAYYFPRRLKNGERLRGHAPSSLFTRAQLGGSSDEAFPNRSRGADEWLHSINASEPSHDGLDFLWHHVVAIGYSPAYLTENREGIRSDWPRIPLPASAKLLTASAKLGAYVTDLLDTELENASGHDNVLFGEFGWVGRLQRADDSKKPLSGNRGDFKVQAGWGRGGNGKPVMPGKGRIVWRALNSREVEELGRYANEHNLAPERARALLIGDATGSDAVPGEVCQVYLNDAVYFDAVPRAVWEYYIGGYQVLKKWLSYREREILGRDLTDEEVRHFGNVIRRLTALVLKGDALDANYRAVCEHCYDWPKK